MEKDDEVKGSGNSYDFGARMYDSRLGRWLSIDPEAGQFSSESPYIFSGNSPIVMKDNDGKKKTWYITYIEDDGTESLIKIVEKNYVKKKIVSYTYLWHFDGKKHPVYKDYDVIQRLTIDMRKEGEDRMVFEEEEEDGETKSWYEQLLDDSPNVIFYGNGKFKGQIEMGADKRGKGKTSVIDSDEAAAILGGIKKSGGFKTDKGKALATLKGIFENIDKIVNAVKKMGDEKPIGGAGTGDTVILGVGNMGVKNKDGGYDLIDDGREATKEDSSKYKSVYE
jgi:RHS repeat-associated protein